MSDDSHVSPAAVVAGCSSSAVKWQVAPRWRDILLGPQGLRVDEWLAAGRVHVVKHGSHRTVYRVDLPERTIFLKHYRVLALLNAATHLLRGSAARREWRNALEVRRRNVATATPLALGERHRGGLVRDSFFVSEAIPNSCTLERYADECLPKLPAAAQAGLRRRITYAVAQLCADAHEAGIYHTDFHRGNVLVALDSGAAAAAPASVLPRLHLIDLPKMWFSRPLSWRRSRDSLAMFAAAWLDRSTRSERWRFWKAYLAGRPELRLADPAAAAADIVRRSRRHGERIIRARDKRSLATNRDFYSVVADPGVGYAVRDMARHELMAVLRDPERTLTGMGATAIKHSDVSVVARTHLVVGGAPVTVSFKRARCLRWHKAVLGLLRRSRALRAWHMGHALRERGIATARPLAVCEPRRHWLRWDSYLAMEWIEGDHLHDFARRLARLGPDVRRRQTRLCARALGKLLGRLHAWNISHRDLKAVNLLISERDGELVPHLIDLDGARLRRRISEFRRARNLARLATSVLAHRWVTRADRLRFLRSYLEAAPLARHDWKWLWRQAQTRSHAIADRMRAAGREVL
ncbi:MAG: hypothetical protein HYX69_08915 [Planctomycetia bacterium]|nr:hypothetical protein [Planctomycetia bacterium]